MADADAAVLAAQLVDRLAEAFQREGRARAEERRAKADAAALLRELHRLGLRRTTLAHRLAATMGRPLPIRERLKLADRLRKRERSRNGVPPVPPAPYGLGAPAAPPSIPATLTEQETGMSRLVKRTIVETYETDDVDDLEAEEGDDGEESKASAADGYVAIPALGAEEPESDDDDDDGDDDDDEEPEPKRSRRSK